MILLFSFQLILCLLPCIVTESSTEFVPKNGSLVLVPNRHDVYFAARHIARGSGKNSYLSRIRFFDARKDAAFETSLLLNALEWLTQGQHVLIKARSKLQVVEYEQGQIDAVVERKGKLPWYRVRLEPTMTHRMVGISEIGVSQQRVESELQVRKQKFEHLKYKGIVFKLLRIWFVTSVIVGISCLYGLTSDEERDCLAGLLSLTTFFGGFVLSMMLHTMFPDAFERYLVS